MLPLPTITIRGRLVVVEDGPDTTTHTCGSHDDAISLAADLEDAAKADRQARADNFARDVADGVDVVYPADFTPEDIVESVPVEATVPGVAAILAEPEIVPEPSDSEPEPTAPLVAVAVDRYEASSQRQMITITAPEKVALFRSVGDRSATFELEPGTHSRWFKGEPGAEWQIRMTDADGEIVASGVIPEG